jgi:hypothetical protein
MISLNGVTLDDDLVWEGEFDSAVISQNIQRTILGTLIVQSLPQVKGRIINLVASGSGNSFSGSFTRTQVEGFKSLEQSGSTVAFTYESQVFSVIVQAGGVKVSPLIPRPDQSNTDLYIGTLTLIEV